MDERLRAVCDLMIPQVRESAGLHDYDGVVPDLSPDGVAKALDRLGGPPLDDPHDEAHLLAFERGLRARFGDLELHRRNPRYLLAALDLAGYDRDYAPLAERMEARRRHVEHWPAAIDAGLESLDAVPAAVATGLLRSVRGAAAGLDPDDRVEGQAIAAHARLVGHLERAAREGERDPALGAAPLARLLAAAEAREVDLGRMEEVADRERARLRAMLAEACEELHPGVPLPVAVTELTGDHPDADGVLDAAATLTEEVLEFTRDRGLLEGVTGDCRVAPSPPSRRWATAMMSWAAPHEPDGTSWFFVTPPDPTWPEVRQREWLAAFSRTTLPSTTVHEVSPGHFAHGRLLRQLEQPVRTILHSTAFLEGWAHYAEELFVEEGFHEGDPRFAAGVAIKALLRVTRMSVAIGLHSGTMPFEEAAARFRQDAFMRGPVAEAEAARATFDPVYGGYTWGKLEILALRDEARRRWRAGFSLRRFHHAMLDLGSPPLGLIRTALERG